MADLRDRMRRAAEDRDRNELRDLAREHRWEVGSYMRHEGRADLSPSERDFAERELRDAGVEID